MVIKNRFGYDVVPLEQPIVTRIPYGSIREWLKSLDATIVNKFTARQLFQLYRRANIRRKVGFKEFYSVINT